MNRPNINDYETKVMLDDQELKIEVDLSKFEYLRDLEKYCDKLEKKKDKHFNAGFNKATDICIDKIIALEEALDETCEKLIDKEEKYKWHDLRKNSNDLPIEQFNCLPIENSSFSDNLLVITTKWHSPLVGCINLSTNEWFYPVEEHTFEECHLGKVIAWRYIEEFIDE